MSLHILIILPLLTLMALLFVKGLKQVRIVSLVGSIAQLIFSFILLYAFWQERSNGNTAAMLFESNYAWFESWHINYHVGVDGISVSMILLTAFVVVAGVLVSWNNGKNE